MPIEHDLGDGYTLHIHVSSAFGYLDPRLKYGDELVAAQHYAKGHKKVMRWALDAKRDHIRAQELAANPHHRSWWRRLLG